MFKKFKTYWKWNTANFCMSIAKILILRETERSFKIGIWFLNMAIMSIPRDTEEGQWVLMSMREETMERIKHLINKEEDA